MQTEDTSEVLEKLGHIECLHEELNPALDILISHLRETQRGTEIE